MRKPRHGGASLRVEGECCLRFRGLVTKTGTRVIIPEAVRVLHRPPITDCLRIDSVTLEGYIGGPGGRAPAAPASFDKSKEVVYEPSVGNSWCRVRKL
jgi:hypothetical protein